VAFSPDGRQLASCDNDGTIRTWWAEGGKPVGTLRGHSGGVFGLAFSPDGLRLASASQDRTAKVWDLTTDQESHTVGYSDGGLNSAIHSLAFSPDGRWLAISDELQREKANKKFYVFDRELGGIRCFEGHQGWVGCVAFASNGLLASGSTDCTVRLQDVTTGKLVRTLSGHGKAVTHLAFSSDGERLASGSEDQTVRVWDSSTGSELQVLEGHADTILAVAFSADGQQVIAVAGDGIVKAWEAVTGRLVGSLDLRTGPLTRATVSRDGRLLACWVQGTGIRIQDVSALARGKAVELAGGRPIEGHKDEITGLAFSPDGERLVSAGDGGTVKLWDVRTGHQALTLRGDPNLATAVVFSPDGLCLATAGMTIKVWEAQTASLDKRVAIAGQRGLVWHERRAQACSGEREWWERAFHLGHLVTAKPGKVEWRRYLGNARAEQGQWELALGDFARTLEMQNDQVDDWYRQAVAQLAAGRHDAYRATCAAMIRRFRKDGNAVRVLYACLPSPDASNPAALAALVESAGLGEGYERILGAVSYRCGRYAEAICFFQKAEAKGEVSRAWDWLFLAMAHHRGGDREKARSYLARAREWMEEADRREKPGDAKRLWIAWSERVEVRSLRREAEALLSR
jgi:WD40 repeat protein